MLDKGLLKNLQSDYYVGLAEKDFQGATETFA